MEFVKKSFIDTTTAIVVGSNTLTAEYVMRRDLTYQYASSGFADDLTTASMVINFDATQSVSRIAMMGLNLKEFNLFYDGVTANTFAITSTSDTITSQWSTNSETSMYLQATPVNCTSVTLDMKATTVANSEKAIGYFLLSDTHLVFDRTPTAENYEPMIVPKETVQKLSDGGRRINRIDEKFNATVSYENITASFRNSLKDIYDLRTEMVFCAFPTSSSWDEICYPVVWHGTFQFFKYSGNNPEAGFDGKIKISEAPA